MVLLRPFIQIVNEDKLRVITSQSFRIRLSKPKPLSQNPTYTNRTNRKSTTPRHHHQLIASIHSRSQCSEALTVAGQRNFAGLILFGTQLL